MNLEYQDIQIHLRKGVQSEKGECGCQRWWIVGLADKEYKDYVVFDLISNAILMNNDLLYIINPTVRPTKAPGFKKLV